MLEPGAVLDARYRILGRLGAGGMATVFRATDLLLGREVAIKVLSSNLTHDASAVRRFEREAEAIASIDHPAVVAIYDVHRGDPEDGTTPYFVMELAAHGSLADRLDATQHLSPPEIVPIVVDIAGGLAELHARGIVHRDLKPSNILLTARGPKLADFGIAKLSTIDADDPRTAVGMVLGSLAYAAPELLAGDAATPAADIYGLAAVAYEALTGRRVRSTDSLAGAVGGRLVPPDPPSSVTPSLGGAFDAVLASALSPDPSSRPDVSLFAWRLEAALGQWRMEADTSAAPLVVHREDDTPSVLGRPTQVTAMGPSALPEAVPRRGAGDRGRNWIAMAGLALGAVAIVALVAVALQVVQHQQQGVVTGTLAPGAVEDPGGRATLVPATPVAPTHGVGPTSAPPRDGTGSEPGSFAAAVQRLRGVAADLDRDSGRDILDKVRDVERSLDRDGREKAAEKARDLVDRIDELVRDGKVGGDDADRLQAAARALLDAVGR